MTDVSFHRSGVAVRLAVAAAIAVFASHVRAEDAVGVWKVVCGSLDGPQGRAAELITAEAGTWLLREPGVYATRVLPIVDARGFEDSTNANLIVVGTLADNPVLAKYLKADDVPAGGYLVRAFADGARNVALVAGSDARNVLWAAVDFVDDAMTALRPFRGNGLKFGADPFRVGELWDNPTGDRYRVNPYMSRRVPRTKVRSVFTWGHPIDDFREYFRNLARMKINRVYLWNNEPPLNAKEVVDWAHSWGVEVFWGFEWGWGTQREKTASEPNDAIVARVLAQWRGVWSRLPGDGIYFQTFTEMRTKELGGEPVARKAVRCVNAIAADILRERPDLRIVFGLHATSVRDHLDEIAAADPRLEILWEDTGAFPFGYWVDTTPETDDAFNRRIVSDPRHPVGLVFKWLMIQDWNRFTYQQGPYLLGVTSRKTYEDDVKLQADLWQNFTVDWAEKGVRAYETVRMVQAQGPDVELNIAAQLNGPIHYPTALTAELFWSADEPFETIRARVLERRSVVK